MNLTTEQNKETVLRFNNEVIGQGNMQTFKELVADDVYNHSAPPGVSTGADGMVYFLKDILRKSFPDLEVEILDQVAERDLVTTRKRIRGKHTAELMGIPASNKD